MTGLAWLLALSLLATGALGLLWALSARRARAALRGLAAAARRMAAGEAKVRAEPQRGAAAVELAAALEELGAGRAAAEGALAAERDLLDGTLASMQEGVLVLDEAGRIDHANPALREMLLWREEVKGRLPLEALRNSELQAVLTRAREQKAEAVAEIEVAGLKPRRLQVRASPLRAGPGGVLAVVVDVTELRRLETLRRDFVANVSHELRTPVATVRSAAETLRNGALQDPEAAARFLSIIERNAERMQHLVDDLLDLTRIESRQLKLELGEPLALREAVEQSLSSFRERAEKKRVRLAAAVPAGLAVRADPRAFEQILSNLVDNAVKYCPEGARVEVRAGPEAGRPAVRVSVEDDGPGIEPRHLPRLFERFYRVDPGRSREMGGTGLGLSIVKHLVEAMKGTVGVDSAPGRGSTFWFTLPSSS